jgi:hypothetical protein
VSVPYMEQMDPRRIKAAGKLLDEQPVPSEARMMHDGEELLLMPTKTITAREALERWPVPSRVEAARKGGQSKSLRKHMSAPMVEVQRAPK